MKPFRERNPLPIGAVGLLVILALLLVAFDAGNLPFLGGGTTMHADFANAAGLQSGDDVLVAGVNVGKVTSIKLDGDRVRVGMHVDPSMKVDDASRADVRIKTLLGQMYVSLTPAGSAPQKGDIPMSRTSTPVDVVQAFTGLGERTGAIDTTELAKAFTTLSATFHGTPKYVHSSLNGLERLSRTVASRDAALHQLLSNASSVTATLASHDAQITKLINDSNLILTTLHQQRATIHRLLIDTSAVAQQLSGLVKENRAVLGPALANVKGTLNILNRNQANLDQTIHLAAPFVRDFTDIVGNGRWFETVLFNLGPQLAAQGCLDVAGVKVCPPTAGTASSSATTSSSMGAK